MFGERFQERLPNRHYDWYNSKYYRNGVEYKMSEDAVEKLNESRKDPAPAEIISEGQGITLTEEIKDSVEYANETVRNLHENVQTVADIDKFLKEHPDAYFKLTNDQKTQLAMDKNAIQKEARRVYGGDYSLEDLAKMSAVSETFMNNGIKYICSDTEGVYGFVYVATADDGKTNVGSREVNLCNEFFNGSDGDKINTVCHEVSHSALQTDDVLPQFWVRHNKSFL